MRFVDEYRAPEQVMQLIVHLRERASHLSYTADLLLDLLQCLIVLLFELFFYMLRPCNKMLQP